MADYVVRMTGQDNLSGTIKQVKSELNDLGKTTSKLDQIDAKFSKITNSTAPLKKQLRDLKTLMAQMNMDGLANTEQYTKIAQEAGKIKDAMDDAAAATKRFSSDTANLDAGVQALQGIVAVGGVATGVMAMFGVENEKVQQAILKVQGALTVLNGVQQVSNVLNKDSALIQTLKAARMRIATAAQVSQTAATKAGTLAQLKLNAAVLANPYVLAAAAIAALAAGIIYWVSTMDDATEAQKGVEEAIKTANEATTKGYEAYMKNKMELDQLKTTLDNFNGSKEEERALVDDLNNKYGNTLGKYKDLASWKKALANVSEYQCKLMAAEAKLAALNAEAYSAWAKAMSGENFEENMAKFKKLKEFADDALDDVNFYKKQVSIAINLSGGTRGSGSGSSGSGSGRSTRTTKTTKGGGSGSTPPPSEEVKGIIANYEKEIQDLKKQINEATSEELIKSLNEDLKKKEAEFTQFKIDVGLEVDPKIAEEEEAKKKAEEIAKKLLEDFQASMNEVAGRYSTGSTFDKLIGDNPFNTNSLEGLKRMMDATENSLKGMYDLKKEFEDAGDTGSDAYQQIIDKIKELEEELAKLGIIVIKTSEEDKALEKKKETVNAVGDSFAALGSIASSVGQMTDDKAINAAAIIAQAIANYILGWTEATAKAASLGPIGWAAFGLATLAQVAAVVAQIHSLSGYASGGIISGGSSYGDQILARVNAGEMVLNRKQQSNLFRAIESGDIGAGQTVLVPEFKIKGSDLYGTLRNFSKSVGKTGKVTGIR